MLRHGWSATAWRVVSGSNPSRSSNATVAAAVRPAVARRSKRGNSGGIPAALIRKWRCLVRLGSEVEGSARPQRLTCLLGIGASRGEPGVQLGGEVRQGQSATAGSSLAPTGRCAGTVTAEANRPRAAICRSAARCSAAAAACSIASCVVQSSCSQGFHMFSPLRFGHRVVSHIRSPGAARTAPHTVHLADLPSRILRGQPEPHPSLARPEHVREPAEGGALQRQPAQERRSDPRNASSHRGRSALNTGFAQPQKRVAEYPSKSSQ